MHPRNIYKTPPDFSKLASKYLEFAKIASIDLNGTVRIDFKDITALRVLTKCLLHSDFNLNVDIPENKLIPTVPLRLNYLLWIEDLLCSNGIKEDIIGIDIGTGASCVYPLLAATRFKWKMLATEIDEESMSCAMKNVKQNNLNDFITLKKSTSEDKLLSNCFNEEIKYVDFCMCNPPFYSSADKMDLARNISRAPPRNARSGSTKEIITPGGEEMFIRKLIEESINLRNSVRIYTTMLGHKNSLKVLCKFLKESGISQFTHTTFQQGKTTRWGLAWSFSDYFQLCDEIPLKKSKLPKPISFIIPQTESVNHSVNDISQKLLQILDDLEIKTTVVEKSDSICTMEIKAFKNTWSHQRRRKRENKSNKSCIEGAPIDVENAVTKIDSEPPYKKFKSCDADLSNSKDEKQNLVNKSKDCTDRTTSALAESNEINFLKAALCIRELENNLLLEIAYMCGLYGKDGVNQIVQYIKNNWC